MPKSKYINADTIRLMLPIVISIGKDLAPKTTTKIDDKLVEALEYAQSNPVIFNLLLTILLGEDDVTPSATEMSAETAAAVGTLGENTEELRALFAISKAD
jgi:hypothetical protein